MSRKTVLTQLAAVLLIASLLLAACTTPGATPAATPGAGTPFKVGIVLVGPQNDKGWSEAHLHGSEYAKLKLPGVETIVVDKQNPGDKPGVTLEQVVDDMISQGAQMIFTTSDDFKAETVAAAVKHPDVTFVHISGDSVLAGEAPPNLGNYMGRMELTKMIAGCAAALTTQTGKLGYLGPLINEETRRLASSAFLGARYCWETYRQKPAAELSFTVTWIGFWFNIPGTTLDPTQVVNDFHTSGVDVVLSGIDTPEASTVTQQKADQGQALWVVPYDYEGACELAPKACLGVPYFNWGPAYLKLISAAREGTWKPEWEWAGPDWSDLNNKDSSAVGFLKGPALSAENSATLDTFIQGLADGSIVLFKGPLNYQDGSAFLTEGETATDEQIWYLPQLLEGMEGKSQ
jgi:simple sugar transport system substrate-binding protein